MLGYKATRDGLVELEYDSCDVLGVDPEMPSCALRLSRAFVRKGGGVSICDSRIRYVKGRWVYPTKNFRAKWTFQDPAIFIYTEKWFAMTHYNTFVKRKYTIEQYLKIFEL